MTRRMMSGLLLLALACSGKRCAGEASTPTPPKPERLVVIFADVTSSLTPEQIVSVQTHVKHIITALPPNTVVHVFSIGRDTETAREIEMNTAPTIDSDAAANRLALWRATLATKVQDDLEQLYQHRRETESDTLSSCITTALRRVASLTTRSTRMVDVFIVSDMIEECGTSMLGENVSLMHRDIRPEIKRASELTEQPVDLRRATITMVRPQYNVITAAQNNQPSQADLERFWRALLAHCNTDSKRVFFGADLPGAEDLFTAPSSTASQATAVQ